MRMRKMAKAQQAGKWLLAVILSAAALPPAHAALPAGCDVLSADKIELPAAFTDDGLLYLRVSLNGATERWFELDTGTTPSAVDLTYARSAKLDLTGHRGRGSGAGADHPAYIQTHADARAGTFTAANI